VKEYRIFTDDLEVRQSADGTATIAGYASVFNSEYEVAGFTESVDPKAFNRSLKNNSADLAVVWSHDEDRVLGTVASGTARFSVDERGLKYEADLNLLDPDGISAYRKISTGKVRQSSFSFQVVRDSWEERDEQPPHRVLREVKLYEASPVLWGANPATEVDVQRAARSLADALEVSVGDDKLVSIPEVLDLATKREATTSAPDDGPAEPPVATQDPEPARVPSFHMEGLC